MMCIVLLSVLLTTPSSTGDSSSTEPTVFRCIKAAGGNPLYSVWDLAEGRCVKKDRPPPIIAEARPGVIPLVGIGIDSLPLLKDVDDIDTFETQGFITVSEFVAPVPLTEVTIVDSTAHLVFDISKVPKASTIYAAHLHLSASYWDGSGECTVTLGIKLITLVNSKTEQIVAATPPSSIFFENAAKSSTGDITNIVRVQQKMLDISRPRPNYTMSEASRLRLDISFNTSSLDAHYIKLFSSRQGFEKRALWPSLSILYSEERWVDAEPRLLPLNRSSLLTISGTFDRNQRYSCSLTRRGEGNVTALMGPQMFPISTARLKCEVPSVRSLAALCDTDSMNNLARCYAGFSVQVYRIWERVEQIIGTDAVKTLETLYVPLAHTGHPNEAVVIISESHTPRPVIWNEQSSRGMWNGPDHVYDQNHVVGPNDYR
jgi:hypothetical protein